jgi:hypothetical protein
METPEISEIDSILARFHNAQTAFLEAQEYMDYYWSVDDLIFEIEHPKHKLVYPMIPIGTWSPDTEQFTWGFAVPQFPESAREAASVLKGLGEKFNRKEYDRDKFDLPHMELDDVLAIAGHHLNSTVVFKEKNMTHWLFFALFEPTSVSRIP